jgi:hypothetical protein
MKTIAKGITLTMLLGLLAIPLSCGDVVDCFQICNRYSDCMTNIDVTECTDRCEDRTDDSAIAEQDAERCEECVDDGACAEVSGCFDTEPCRNTIVAVND